MARAATGVEQLEVFQPVGPAFELAGRRRAVFQRAQVGQRHGAGLARVTRHPPSPQRVVEQEVHHVGLGEELGDGRQLVGANLHLRGVDFVLSLGLPELVDPAQAVAGLEHLGRQRSQQALQLALVLGCKGHLEDRALWLEHLRQHAGGQLAGQLPLRLGAELLALQHGLFVVDQVLAVLQRHRGAQLPHEQPVLGQEAGEQHAVPVFVGHFPHQVLQSMGVVLGLHVAQRPAMGAQAAAQGLEVVTQVVRRLRLAHGQLPQRGQRGLLGYVAGELDGVLELAAQGLRQRLVADACGRHGVLCLP